MVADAEYENIRTQLTKRPAENIPTANDLLNISGCKLASHIPLTAASSSLYKLPVGSNILQDLQ